MKKFNLFNEIITANKDEVLQAMNKNKTFGITIYGDVVYEPFDAKDIFIFQGKLELTPPSALSPQKPKTLPELFGSNYQVVEDGERLLIKAFSNWQQLIEINTPNASYDDTTADGVAEFGNKELEDIGWHATEFDIDYRTLVEVLEEKCEGIVLCIEQEEPYQFSGLGFLTNDEEAKKVLFEYCQTHIKKLMAEDALFAKENLEDDELEALEFFQLD